MLRSRTSAIALAVTAAVAMVIPAGTASAADADVIAACEAKMLNNLDGTGTITNMVGSAGESIGCVTTVHTPTGSITSAQVSVVSGWSYTVKRSTNKITVDFRSDLGAKVSYKIEPGKLVIR